MKVVINTCYGSYNLSEAAYTYLGKAWDGGGFAFSDERAHPQLVEVVEKLGERASGPFAKLKVVEIPDYVTEWYIHVYDGMEEIHGPHESWS